MGLIGGPIGFGLPIILKLELALPGFIPCSPLQYNPNITFYGIFMIPSMIMSILIGGFGNIFDRKTLYIRKAWEQRDYWLVIILPIIQS